MSIKNHSVPATLPSASSAHGRERAPAFSHLQSTNLRRYAPSKASVSAGDQFESSSEATIDNKHSQTVRRISSPMRSRGSHSTHRVKFGQSAGWALNRLVRKPSAIKDVVVHGHPAEQDGTDTKQKPNGYALGEVFTARRESAARVGGHQ